MLMGLLALTSVVAYSQPSRAAAYDPAAAFEAGWLSSSNPNGVWSSGYSSTLGGSVTLYTTQINGADSANQQMWVAPSVNCCTASPSVGFNNGAAFNDGNVAQAANQILLVSSVFQNLVTNLIFTAPTSGSYSLAGSFIGDQQGINVGVDVLMNSSVLFSSNVTSFGQIVPFNSNITLAAGDTLTFAVLQGPGTQNTGLDVSISATPLPATWGMMLLGLGVLGFMGYRRSRKDGVLAT